MDWSYFIYFAAPTLFCWIGGAWLAYRPSFSKGAVAWTVFGLAIFSAFIIGMWISLERPPLRTMGETRLWYSFFLPVAGVITYVRWRYKWILSFSTLLAFVFICVNLFKPEIHNKTLMPALQSPWFAPHVIVYMFSYAMLGAAAAQTARVRERVQTNLAALHTMLDDDEQGMVSVLRAEGGWNVLLRVPSVLDENELVLSMIEKHGISGQPGYFFDMTSNGYLAISLLPEPDEFRHNVQTVLDTVNTMIG